MAFLAAATLSVWIYLIFFRGSFWREFRRRPAQATVEPPRGSIVAVIPARNEGEVIGAAVASLGAQRYTGPFHIVVVDDDSSDGTAACARAVASPEQLTVVRAAPLPPGWTGKLWALSEGVRSGAARQPDYLLFTDADIVHPADALDRLAGCAAAESYDLVSYMATLQCRSFAEQALVPAFVFFFFMLYPPEWIRDPRRATAGAAGGCILIRRTMLEAIGGIAAIRDSMIDDCALAHAVKRAGGRVWLGLSPEMRSIRSYGTFGEIGRMVSRTAFTQLRHSPLLLAGTLLGLVVTYLLPPLLTLFAPQPARGIAALAWLTMSLAYLPAVRYYRRPWFGAPLLPLVAVFYLGATVHSALSYWRGAGGQWKGRVQDVRT